MGAIETDTFLLLGMVLALGAGALSFLSPCVLPIFPAYLSYITGISVKELNEHQNTKIRGKLLSHSVFFLLGVSLIFIDRKSTRLNSSHVAISYAVFCLKKKITMAK